MTRKVSNRKVGPKSREYPDGKHHSLLQKITYTYSSGTPFNKVEWARKEREFRSSDSWSITPLLDGYKTLAITYLENSPHDHTKCENWQWGLMTSKESKAAAKLDGGFEAAFQMLFGIYLINKELDGGDMEKAIVHSLRLVHSARIILAAELEPLYHAGNTKIKAFNKDKSKESYENKEKARETYQTHVNNGKTKTQASKLTMEYLKEEHNIDIPSETIRGWFKT